jgi:ectoine hydroxylase-related dioxygenase (phytanoyl-CoA dioxygenase family)
MLQKFEPGEIEAAIEFFHSNGFVVFRNAVSPAIADAFWEEVEENVAHNPHLQFSMHGRIYTGRDLPENLRVMLPRIIDIQGHAALTVHLMFGRPIPDFLHALYGTAPTCLQTLTYKFSSEQGAHSDCYLVSPPCVGDYNRRTLTAAWIPFEVSTTRNGALIVYPGSHKLAKKRLDTDFRDNYSEYVRYLNRLCITCGCPPQPYDAEVGDVLLWHGDLVHAGGPIQQQSPRPTRRSLICHYGVVPANRPSLTPDWVRLKTPRGSYYMPSSSVIAGPSSAGIAAPTGMSITRV